MVKTIATRNTSDKAVLRKGQIPAGVQVVASKHCLFLSLLCLQHEFCTDFWAMQGTLFFVDMRRAIR